MQNSKHKIQNFFEQYRVYTLKDIDDIFGNSFLLRNINQNETYAAACINKLADLDFFKKLIDKLFIPQNHTYPVEYFCNQKTPYKKEKISYLIGKISKKKINQEQMAFLFFSSWFNKETEVFNLILKNYYQNDLSSFNKGNGYNLIGKHFLLQDPALVSLLVEKNFPFDYNDLNFLPPKHTYVEKIINTLKKTLPLDKQFKIDLSDNFAEEINLPEQLLRVRPKQIISDFEISVSRPNVSTTLIPLLIKKGYPASVCEKFINEDEFKHTLFNIVNIRDVYNFKLKSSQELRDTDKWSFFIKKYPNAEILPKVSLFGALVATLFNDHKPIFNYKNKFKKEISLILELLENKEVNCDIYADNLHSFIDIEEEDYLHNSKKLHELLINTPLILRQALTNKNFVETLPQHKIQDALVLTYFFNAYKDKIVTSYRYNNNFDKEDTQFLAESIDIFFQQAADIIPKNLYFLDEHIFNAIEKNKNINHKEFYKDTLFNYMDGMNESVKSTSVINEVINHNFDNFFERFISHHSDKEALFYFDKILLSYDLDKVINNPSFKKISDKRSELYDKVKFYNKPRI